MKKETLLQIPEEANRVENHYSPEGLPSWNIWVSFSHSEVQPGEEIPSRRFFGFVFVHTKRNTSDKGIGYHDFLRKP